MRQRAYRDKVAALVLRRFVSDREEKRKKGPLTRKEKKAIAMQKQMAMAAAQESPEFFTEEPKSTSTTGTSFGKSSRVIP